MKVSDCFVGMLVGWHQHGSDYSKGKVIAAPFTTTKGVSMVVVECDQYQGAAQNLEVSKLMTLPAILIAQEKAQAEKDRLERDFQRVAIEVKAKLDSAASLVNEAQALARTVSHDARRCGDAANIFQDALDDSGWYNSSANC